MGETQVKDTKRCVVKSKSFFYPLSSLCTNTHCTISPIAFLNYSMHFFWFTEMIICTLFCALFFSLKSRFCRSFLFTTWRVSLIFLHSLNGCTIIYLVLWKWTKSHCWSFAGTNGSAMNGAVQCVMSTDKYLLVDCLLKECKQKFNFPS